jgi:hypothetical protein
MNLSKIVAFEYVLVSNSSFDGSTMVEESVVLYPNEKLEPGQYKLSPNGMYRAGLSESGNLVVEDMHFDPNNPLVVWSTGLTPDSVSGCYMQIDGNLLIRDGNTNRIWSSRTHGYPASILVLDDNGQIAITYNSTYLWMAGLPRDYYNHSLPTDMEFPIRATFYYPWYPETFTVDGNLAHYKPSLGWYSSSDPMVARAHIDSMIYANIELSIASWWGQDSHLDRARLTMLLDKTIAINASLRWTVYYELEMNKNPSPYDIQKDLNYLLAWFARHPAWAYKDNKPIIFVYNENTGCDVVSRWMEASKGEWFVVLKVFKDYDKCTIQPDSWHQYGSGDDGVVHNKGYSFVVSPGFWRAGNEKPRVPRLSSKKYCHNVQMMVNSGEPWQLVLSFNEAGEGTMIESSESWSSATIYGQYLDCLHGIIPSSDAAEMGLMVAQSLLLLLLLS